MPCSQHRPGQRPARGYPVASQFAQAKEGVAGRLGGADEDGGQIGEILGGGNLGPRRRVTRQRRRGVQHPGGKSHRPGQGEDVVRPGQGELRIQGDL